MSEQVSQNVDIIYKIAVAVMAICNFCLAIYIFFFNKGEGKKKDEKNNRQTLLSILVLNYKMKEFYEIFDKIQAQVVKFRKETITEDFKNSINEGLEEVFSEYRRKFAEPIGAIDSSLYKELMDIADRLQSELSTAIFDKGVNLDVEEKYSSLIDEPIISAQRDMIKALNNYL